MATITQASSLESVYVLVDWDNLEGTFPGRNMAEQVAYELRERVAGLCITRFPTASEVEVRCYSAWLEPSGAPTRTGLALRHKIEAVSSRVRGVSVRLECVDGMVVQGAPPIFAHLAGPRECRCSARNPVFEQKMVDTIIVADAIALAEYDSIVTVVVGDDVDMAPGVAMAGLQRAAVTKRATSSEEVLWLRRRPQTRQTRMLTGVATIEEW